ncbi:MAG: hypothetical protein ACRD68_10075, partial [Pyrinomonadaceae bacterium]
MLNTFFSHLLSHSHLSRRARKAAVLLITLSPLAYLAAVVVINRTDPNTQVNFAVDRGEAVRVAARYADGLGLDVSRWDSACKAEVNNGRHFYYRLRRGEEAARVRRLAPEAFITVLFVSPDRRESLDVQLAPDGRPLGYKRNVPGGREGTDAGEPAARAVAEAAFQSLLQREGITQPPGAPVLSNEQRKFSGVSRTYSWRLPMGSLPELDLQAVFTVSGGDVTSQQLTSKFDDAYADRHFVNRWLPAKLAVALYYLLIFLVVCYGLFRYVQRARQKEVSHARSLLLCVAA